MGNAFRWSGFVFLVVFGLQADCAQLQNTLKEQYERCCREPSDIYEHIPVLCSLARECSSVVEIGLRRMVSTWGILQGLSESEADDPTYLGIDIECPPDPILDTARELATANRISFQFCQANDLYLDFDMAVDMLFIDSMHTYCHLSYELEMFSPKVKKVICMHDTSDSWGTLDDVGYVGDYSEYPLGIDRIKRGLWAAVEDFLERHPEWILSERRTNNNGFTVLRRI